LTFDHARSNDAVESQQGKLSARSGIDRAEISPKLRGIEKRADDSCECSVGGRQTAGQRQRPPVGRPHTVRSINEEMILRRLDMDAKTFAVAAIAPMMSLKRSTR
jgi:hypothetical protein